MSFGDHMDYLAEPNYSRETSVDHVALGAKEPWIEELRPGIDWAKEGCDHSVLAIAYAAQAGAPEIPVTAEMIAAAYRVYGEMKLGDTNVYPTIYRAMRAAEPPRDDDFLSARKAYREQFVVAVQRFPAEIAKLKRIIASLQEMSEHQADAVGEASNLLVMKDARIAALDAENAALAEENERQGRGMDERHTCYREVLRMKDARIAELDTELALLRRAACDNTSAPNGNAPHPPSAGSPVAQAPDPIPAILHVPKPPKVHNPFQTFPTDPRRMGP